jgi:hypothetical protein
MDVNSKLADAYYGYSFQDELEEAFNHWISFKTDEELIEYAEDFDLDVRDENGNLKNDWFEKLAEYWIENRAADYDEWDYFDD